MREIDVHSIEVLEFPRVREIISGQTLSPYGRRHTGDIRPLFNRDTIELSLRRSAQMRDIIRFEQALPLVRIEDITGLVDKSAIDGMRLDAKALLEVKLFLDTVVDLATYAKGEDRDEKFPDIVEILSTLHPKREIGKAINKAIDSAGDVLSSASSALARIRRNLGDCDSQIKQHLTKILSGRTKHAGWQDDVITVRDGRYVIPFLSGDFRHESGIVHDKSHSGATLYVEPSSAIPINNKLRQLQQDEKLEIDRILRELTAMVGDAADDITADLDTYGLLDAIHACAAFAIKINAATPTITDDSGLQLIDARHPLLMYAAESFDQVVPIDITLDRDNQGVLVTGPNTGGKTVAIKTIGLLTLMAMSGLEIPADHKSVVGIYHKIYADIGDEQSLELSLSTFSSHIRNIIAAVRDADANSLILFDEIGAGTDPREGAALAEVLIIDLMDRGCNLVATTHYSQLKTLPLEQPGLLNASLEFDRVNLQPTFRLKMGVPGASYAIDIARRLGLPGRLADRAASLLTSDERSLDKLIERLDNDLDSLQREKAELEGRLEKNRRLEEVNVDRQKKLDRREQELQTTHLEELERQLQEGRREMDRLIRDIRQSQAASDKVKESHRVLKEKSEDLTQRRAKHRKTSEVPDQRVLKPGERVWIDKFQTEGDVVEMQGDKKVKVAIGKAFMTVSTIEVKRLAADSSQNKKNAMTAGVNAKATSEFHPEIMLLGMTVEEAIEALEKFLDDALIAGVGQVYVVHGKGTGRLRKNLSTYLKQHSAVDSIRIGDWNEGGHGVTIARLKV